MDFQLDLKCPECDSYLFLSFHPSEYLYGSNHLFCLSCKRQYMRESFYSTNVSEIDPKEEENNE